jgi:membrane fusion protein (multidrug efflux system)
MKLISWVGAIVACLLVAAALGLYKYNEIQAAIEMGKAFPEPAEAVEVYVVKTVQRTPSLSVTGEVVATQSAVLQNELAGRIVKVGFAPGARVQAGQVLLQLDVSQEQAKFNEARADQKIASLALERAQRLVKSGAGSVEARDQARAQYDAAQARVAALEALIEKKTLRAPFNAVSSLHQLEAGQFLDAGTEITRLVGIADHIWIDFSIPQDKAAITIGSRVQVLADERAAPVAAEVIARDAAVNVNSRNLRMRASLPAAAVDLLPGMLVRVKVPLGTQNTAMLVPPTAVRRDAMGASVYLLETVEENGQPKTRARRRSVRLAEIREADLEQDLVMVLEGLRPGDEIAGVGAFKLRDGSLVATKAPNPAADERVVGR